jgi:hypothetical protein
MAIATLVSRPEEEVNEKQVKDLAWTLGGAVALTTIFATNVAKRTKQKNKKAARIDAARARTRAARARAMPGGRRRK